MKQTEIDILVKTLQSLADKEPEPTPQIEPEQPKPATIKVYPFVTFNGEKPPEPKSFFSTWKFKLSASLFALFVGFVAYFFVFAR